MEQENKDKTFEIIFGKYLDRDYDYLNHDNKNRNLKIADKNYTWPKVLFQAYESIKLFSTIREEPELRDKIIPTMPSYKYELCFRAKFILSNEYKHPILGFGLAITNFRFNYFEVELMFLDKCEYLVDTNYVYELLDYQKIKN